MKRFLIISAVVLLSSFVAGAQFRDGSAYADLYDSENIASMKEHVRYLSSAMMEGRAAGSEGETLAAEYVTEQLKSYGVDVLSPKNGDVFGIKRENGDTLTSRNVMGYVQGYDKELRDHFIVVGARLDKGDVAGTDDRCRKTFVQEKIYCHVVNDPFEVPAAAAVEAAVGSCFIAGNEGQRRVTAG